MSQANPKDGILLAGVPLSVTNPGQIFWVNNSGVIPDNGVGGTDASSRGSYLRPFATLDYAIGKCTASRGDVIMLMPGHAENVAAAGVTLDVIGITVVGLGSGSLIPKFSFTAAASDINITAANVAFYNVQFEANFADVLVALDVSGNNLGFYNCKFTESGTNLNYVVVMNIADGNDDLTIDSCEYVGNDVANDNFVQAAGTHDNFVITNNRFSHLTAQTAGEGMIEIATDANNFFIAHNHFFSATAAIDNGFVTMADAGNTGWAAHNYLKGVDTDATAANILGSFDVTGLGCFENYAVMDVDALAVATFLTAEDLT